MTPPLLIIATVESIFGAAAALCLSPPAAAQLAVICSRGE